jgi:NitT/TauT family transport system substrate-binding protein
MKRSWIVILLATTLAMAPATYGTERLRVGHDLWIGFSGVFLAQELGYFRDLGVEVDLRGFPGPGDSIPPLLAGHLDVSLTTLHNLALIAGADDAPITAIYFLDASHGADAIVAGTDVVDLADLRGRDIAVTLNEANHMLLILALESVGLSEKDVNLVNMSADDAGAAFLAGRVDAAVTWEPWVSRARSGGDGRVIFSTRDVPDTIINTVSVRRDNLDRRPDALANFLKGIDQGVAFLQSDPEAAIPIIARWLEADPDDVRGMLAEDEIYGLDENRKLFGDGDGPAVQALERVISFLDERDLIRTRPAAESLVDSRLIP